MFKLFYFALVKYNKSFLYLLILSCGWSNIYNSCLVYLFIFSVVPQPGSNSEGELIAGGREAAGCISRENQQT